MICRRRGRGLPRHHYFLFLRRSGGTSRGIAGFRERGTEEEERIGVIALVGFLLAGFRSARRNDG